MANILNPNEDYNPKNGLKVIYTKLIEIIKVLNTAVTNIATNTTAIEALEAQASGVITLKVSLTASQIKNSFTTPIDIIDAPGVGYATQILNVAENFVFGTTPFNTTNSLYFQTETAAAPQITSDVPPILASRFGILPQPGISGTQIVENKKLQITSDADSTLGDSTIDYYIQYRLIEL